MKFLKELFMLIKILFTVKLDKVDKLEFIKTKYFPPKGFLFCMWCGKLLYREEKDSIINSNESYIKTLLHHEQIHLDQAKNAGSFLKFYLLYFWNWLKNFSFSKKGAYYTNKYEVEAYANENNLDYVGTGDNKYDLKDKRMLYKRHKKNWKVWIKSYYRN